MEVGFDVKKALKAVALSLPLKKLESFCFDNKFLTLTNSYLNNQK